MASIEKRLHQDKTSYRVKIRVKGRPVETATFERLTDAKRWAQQTEADIRRGKYFQSSEARKHTLAELADRYIAEILPHKPKMEKKQRAQLLWWKQEIGAYLLADINAAIITQCKDKLQSGVTIRKTKRSPATVNRYLAALSHAFTVAVNEWMWLDDSPMRKVSKAKESRGRVRFLNEDERDALLEACKDSSSPYLYMIVLLAISTGMRRGEIMNLEWKDINLEEGYLLLHHTKNNERRRIPLAGMALVALKDLKRTRQRLDTDLLFPSAKHGKDSSPVELNKHWLKAMEEAEIEDFRFHDLRHTAASYLAMSGATLAEIAEVLGHKTLAMVKRYAHLSEAHTSAVVERMNQRFLG